LLNNLNWVCNPLLEDFGIDFHVKAFESKGQRRSLPWEFHVQLKGTTRLRYKGDIIPFPIDTSHLNDWYESPLPVLFVVYDVRESVGYWLIINEYLDQLEDDWESRKSLTLRIPAVNVATPEGLLTFLRRIKKAAFLRAAPGVISYLETPSEDGIYDEHFWPSPEKPYQQPLPDPDANLHDLALARCILCQSYFWIDEGMTAGWDKVLPGEDLPENLDFTIIYRPRACEPAVFSCDTPEELCPFCSIGRGALLECRGCGRYNVHCNPGFAGWDDPLVEEEEALENCSACLAQLRTERMKATKTE
jgi:hypothetical protein